jgi:hypothetical protein
MYNGTYSLQVPNACTDTAQLMWQSCSENNSVGETA